MTQQDKIFIIGLPRTGTTSVCASLLELGFSVAHTAYTQQTFSQAQAIADTPIFNDFALLDSAYPNSKFIYLTRELTLWLPSIQQLLQRMAANLLRNDGGFNPIIKRCYLNTFTPFTVTNINNMEFLERCYQQHQKQVLQHFQACPEKLLTIDISQVNAYQQLCRFLLLPEKQERFQAMNKGGKITAWNELTHPRKIPSTNKGRSSKLAYFEQSLIR